MGRNANSGRRPLAPPEIALLKTLQDECSQVRVTLEDKSNRQFASLKHWVQVRAIPLFNNNFHPADGEEGDVSIFSIQDFRTKFVLENLPVVQKSLQGAGLRSSGQSDAPTSRRVLLAKVTRSQRPSLQGLHRGGLCSSPACCWSLFILRLLYTSVE